MKQLTVAAVALLCGFQDNSLDLQVRIHAVKKDQRYEVHVAADSRSVPAEAVIDFAFRRVSLAPDLSRGGLFPQIAETGIDYSAQLDRSRSLRFEIHLPEAGYYEVTASFLEQSQVVMDIRSKFETRYYPFANKQTVLIGSQKNALDRISADLKYLEKRIPDAETMVQEIERLVAAPEPERDYKTRAAAVDRLIVELGRERSSMILTAAATALQQILMGWKSALEKAQMTREAEPQAQITPKEQVKNPPAQTPSGELKPELKLKGMSVEHVPDLKVEDAGPPASSGSTSEYKVDRDSVKAARNHMQAVWKILYRETGLYLLWLARDIDGAARTNRPEDTRLRMDLESRLESLVRFDQGLRANAAYARETSLQLRDPRDQSKTRPMGFDELLKKLQELLTLTWDVLENPSDADKTRKHEELRAAVKDLFDAFERHLLS